MNKKWITILVTVVVGIVLDQYTKILAVEHLQGKPTITYLNDMFRLTYAENSGAFLGLGSTLPPLVRTAIFSVAVSIFLAGFVYYIYKKTDMSFIGNLSSALVISGGIGNLIDRIFNGGYVVDFMNMGINNFPIIGVLRTGIFNVADIWIMVGAGLLLFAPEFREKKEEKESKKDSGIAT